MIEDGGLTMTNLILCFCKVEHPNCALHILWAINFPPTSATALPVSTGDALNGARISTLEKSVIKTAETFQ